MSLRYEVWPVPGISGTYEKKIAALRPLSASGTLYRFQSGTGIMQLPAGYDRLGEIIEVDPSDHTNDVASLIRVYRGSDLIQELLVNQSPNIVHGQAASLNLDGIEAVMDWAVAEAWDWDGSADYASKFPDWIYGGTNVLVDPSFADPRCDPRISEFWTDATSGNWSATVDGQSTGNTIPFNATALQVEQAYEALSSVDDVLVEGSGDDDDPWRVTFVDPCFPTSYTVNSGTLNENLNQTLIETGSQQPNGWTKAQTLQLGVNIQFGAYTTFNVGTAPGTPPDGATTALHIVGTKPYQFSFPGAQQVPRVIGGGTYQAGVWVYPVSTNQDFRLIIRDIQEEPLYASSTWPSQTLTAGQWTLLSTSVEVPEGVDQVIFRVSAIEDSADFWVTDAFLNEGLQPTTVGEIMGDLLDDAQTDHAASAFTRSTIDFINKSFTDSQDTAGNSWTDSEVSVNIPRGMTYRKILDRVFGALGYEWNLSPTTGTPGEWDLNIWNPDGRGTDYSAADTPSLLVGQGVLGGSATKQLPRSNIILSEGSGQYTSRAKSTDSIGTAGAREWYQADVSYFADQTNSWTDKTLARFLDVTMQPRFEIADPQVADKPVPVVDYGLADTLNVDLADGSGKISRQIEAISWRTISDGIVWGIHTGQAQFDAFPPSASTHSGGAGGGHTGGGDAVGAGPGTGGVGNPGNVGGGVGNPGNIGGGVGNPNRFPGGVDAFVIQAGTSIAAQGPTVEGVRRLLDNFDRQREPHRPSAALPGGGGGDPSVMVAASDAQDIEKSKADFVCTGAADDAEIMAAFQMLNVGANPKGRIVLSSGTFHVRGDQIVLQGDMHLHGMGRHSTEIRCTDPGAATVTINDSAAEVHLSNLDIVAQGTGTTYCVYADGGNLLMTNVDLNFGEYGVFCEQNQVEMIGCSSEATLTYFIGVDGLGYRSFRVADSVCWGILDFANAVSVEVVGNTLHGTVRCTDPRGVVIASNHWESANATANTAMIELGGQHDTGDSQDAGCVVIGNVVAAEFDFAVDAQDVVGLVVAGNATFKGSMRFVDCDDSIIANNQLVDADLNDRCLDISSDRCTVQGNHVSFPGGLITDNTEDEIYIAGNRNLVMGNQLVGTASSPQPRYGINVASGECNMVVGNDLGDPDDYATDALIDAGSNTQLEWPNDATYGDNFTDCGSGS